MYSSITTIRWQNLSYGKVDVYHVKSLKIEWVYILRKHCNLIYNLFMLHICTLVWIILNQLIFIYVEIEVCKPKHLYFLFHPSLCNTSANLAKLAPAQDCWVAMLLKYWHPTVVPIFACNAVNAAHNQTRHQICQRHFHPHADLLPHFPSSLAILRRPQNNVHQHEDSTWA